MKGLIVRLQFNGNTVKLYWMLVHHFYINEERQIFLDTSYGATVKILSKLQHFPNCRTCSLLIKSKMCQHNLINEALLYSRDPLVYETYL